MNKLSRYSFLLTIVTLSVTFRISHIYVGGGDSWGMATYVSALTQSGTLSWFLHKKGSLNPIILILIFRSFCLQNFCDSYFL